MWSVRVCMFVCVCICVCVYVYMHACTSILTKQIKMLWNDVTVECTSAYLHSVSTAGGV